MKILLLPNAFKGSLSAVAATRIMQRALAAHHRVKAFPVSDGGDGFIAFFQALDKNAVSVRVRAKNAFLQDKNTSFLMLSDRKTAVLETARICGLGKTPRNALDPLGASSFGIGQVILAAARKGARRIFIGLGGVACHDGGAGMLAACGAEITDRAGRAVPLGSLPLCRAAQVNLQPIYAKNPALKKVTFVGFSDVKNPVLGPRGASRVFGPQKGASPQQVVLLEKALTAWVRALEKHARLKLARKPATAAAGAIALGVAGGLKGTLVAGAQTLFEKAKLEKQVRAADLIITTEGKLDCQTFYGKAPLAVLKLARKYRKPVLFICGQLEENALKNQPLAPARIAVLADFARDCADAKKHAAKYLARVCKSL